MANQRRSPRSRIYSNTTEGAPTSGQDKWTQAMPYLTPDLQRDAGRTTSTSTAHAQRGQHGEGAETTGNSARGALSGGLSGATTTRGGQQGGIGASAYDVEPGDAPDDVDAMESPPPERDLTLGERFGGAMEDPDEARP